MLKKLRWKFTIMSVIAIAIVFIALATSINIFYRSESLRGEDNLLEIIADNNGDIPRDMPHDPPEKKYTNTNRFTKETPFDTRFFTITVDDKGNITESHMDKIAAVTGNDSGYYLDAALNKNSLKGTVGSYRFLKSSRDDDGCLFIFLDITRQQRSAGDLLKISVFLSVIALIAAFLISYILSGKAIAPTVESIENQKRFITDASHEMKTPLTALSAYTTVLKENSSDSEWINGIEAETNRLSSLVTDLVDLSRWDESRPLSDARVFSITDSIWDVVTPYKRIAVANSRELIANITDDLSVFGDEASIQKALSALLENAIKYSLPDTDIYLRATRQKKKIQIDVQNECLIDKNINLNMLFNRFYRTDSSRSRESGGNGVGLSIAKAIINAHSGDIEASYMDENTILFRITLPAV